MAAREVLVSEMAEKQDFVAFQPGVWCEKCNKRLVELKRQTLKLILPELNNVIQYEGSLHRVCNIYIYIFFTTSTANSLTLTLTEMRKE